MKHFYNAIAAVMFNQLTTRGLAMVMSSKIYSILLVTFFLLMGGEGMAQATNDPTITNVNTNCALLGQDVTLTIVGANFRSNNDNGGASRVIINGGSVSLEPYSRTSTELKVFVPKNLINGSSFTVVVIQQGTANTAVYSTPPATAYVINLTATPGQSCNPGEVTLTASGAPSGQGYEYRWYDAAGLRVGGTGSSLTIPFLDKTTTYYVSVASSGCETVRMPVKATIGGVQPTVTGDRRCDAGMVTLTASDAPAGSSYKWYDAQTGGTVLYTGSTYNTYVSNTTTFFVGVENSAGCENPRVPVEAVIGSINAPTVSANVNCNSTGREVITFYAYGAKADEHYRWYDKNNEFVTSGSSITRETNRDAQTGLHYVIIVNNNNTQCRSDKTYLVVPSTNNLVPEAPEPFTKNTCGSGEVDLAPPMELGMTYRWYTASGVMLHEGLTYTTPSLSGSTSYLVSKVNTATRCESTKATVTVTMLQGITLENGRISVDTDHAEDKLEVGKRASFEVTSEIIDANDVEYYEWQITYDGMNWVGAPNASLSSNRYEFAAMPTGFTGIRVNVKARRVNACYANLNSNGIQPYSYMLVSPLPVELVTFKAQRHAQGVRLTWTTASEQDNSGFEVQVSKDAKNFEKIGFVESKVGTTSIRQDYSFLDTKAVSGTRYYRLKQIDLDGTSTYSAIRAVALDEGNGQVAAYPNPFDNVVTVKLNGTEARKVSVVVFNAQGKAIKQQQEETTGNTITVNMTDVTAKGMYMLHVLDNGQRYTFKLMKR